MNISNQASNSFKIQNKKVAAESFSVRLDSVCQLKVSSLLRFLDTLLFWGVFSITFLMWKPSCSLLWQFDCLIEYSLPCSTGMVFPALH